MYISTTFSRVGDPPSDHISHPDPHGSSILVSRCDTGPVLQRVKVNIPQNTVVVKVGLNGSLGRMTITNLYIIHLYIIHILNFT